jgi:hypothetical protein
MKKKILIGIAAVAVVAIVAVNVNYALQGSDLSALSLANVEALAQEKTDHCTGHKSGECKCKNDHTCYDTTGCN